MLISPVDLYCREQQTRKDLNIVTGFQLLDGRHHLFILEGLRDEAVKHIWESVTKPKEGNNIYYGTTVSPCVIILIHLFSKLYYITLNMSKVLSQIPSPIWERWWVRKKFICLLLL